MQHPSPSETFWPAIQPLLDRSHDVVDQRNAQRLRAIAAAVRQLDPVFEQVLQGLNLTELVNRCQRCEPALPVQRIESLSASLHWREVRGVYLRAFYVLHQIGNGRRRLVVAHALEWNPSCAVWHGGDGDYRGFVATVMLELAIPQRDGKQPSAGRSYSLLLHPDRIRVADSEAVWREPALQTTLSRLAEMQYDIETLTRLSRAEPLNAPAVNAAQLAVPWQPVALPPAQKEALVRLQCDLLVNAPGSPRSVLISGPTGVGKSLVARALMDGLGAETVNLDDRLNRLEGNKAIVEQLERDWHAPEVIADDPPDALPRVLLLEDCEQWFTMDHGGRSEPSVHPGILRSFLRHWDAAVTARDEPIADLTGTHSGIAPPRVLFIATTRHPERLDRAVRSRFDLHVEIALPDAACRERLIMQAMADDAVPSTACAVAPAPIRQSLVTSSRGLSARELCATVRSVMRQDCDGPSGDRASRLLAVLNRRRQRDNPSVDATARWDRLVLPVATRETLEDLVFQLQEATALRQAGFKPAAAVLLHGPPGTGKTQSARTLANEAGLAFIAASTAELKAGYIGQSGERVRSLFAEARRRAPAILFLDEIDAVAADRDGGNSDSFNQEVVTQLLQELDGVRDHSGEPVLVVAATNRIAVLDPALRSRFRETLKLDLPTPDERAQLLERLLKPLTVESDARALMFASVKQPMCGNTATRPGANVDGSGSLHLESHRDIEQWVHRVLGLSVRRVRHLRSASSPDGEVLPLSELLRITREDVVSSFGEAIPSATAAVDAERHADQSVLKEAA